MLINVFGQWINPNLIPYLWTDLDPLVSGANFQNGQEQVSWKGRSAEEIAQEINRLILENQRVTSGETPVEILNKIQRNMVNVVQALVINKDSFQPEAHFKESFNVWLDLATKTLKEAGIKTSL
jgi:hypothetical protein